MQHWYVLHTKPHKERQVAERMRQDKLEVFLPMVRVNPTNPRAAGEHAYFPCYLFVRADLQSIGPSVLQWAPGVRRLVTIGEEPSTVPSDFIHRLKGRLNQIRAAGGLVFDGLERGDKVRIIAGPFVGYEALFDIRLSGSDRVRVLLEFLGRRTRTEVNAGDIRKIRLRPQ